MLSLQAMQVQIPLARVNISSNSNFKDATMFMSGKWYNKKTGKLLNIMYLVLCYIVEVQ